MDFAVLGIGKTGQGMAALLCSKGLPVVMWDRTPGKVDAINEKGITCTGMVEGHFSPRATADMAEAAKADYLFVMTVAAGHAPVARQLRGHLKQNQRIVIFNGNWGAAEMAAILGDEVREKNVLVAETGGMLLLCDSDEPGVCKLKKIKQEMNFAAIPAPAAQTVAEELQSVLPGLVPAGNVLETSINNSNPILHAPITLFNLTRVENGERFTFYDTAATRRVLAFAEKADAERVAVANAMGAKGESCLDIVNGFWPEKQATLYDAIKNNAEYMSGLGPVSLDYRYISEDIPYGIVPLVKMARQYNVDAPYLTAMLDMYCMFMDHDYYADGPQLDEMDFTRLL